MRKQHKRTNLNKIYNELIKTMNFENISTEHFHNRMNELIVSKPNRNDDSCRVNESVVDYNI